MKIPTKICRVLCPSIVLSVLFFCAPGFLWAGVTLSDEPPGAGSVIVGSQSPKADSSIQYGRSITQNQYGGVAFDLDAPAKAEAATFYLHSFGEGAPGADVRVLLVKFDGGIPLNPVPNPTTEDAYPHSVVQSEEMRLPAADELRDGKYVTFQFSAPVALEKGTYGVVLQFAQPGSRQALNLRADVSRASGAVTFRTSETFEKGVLMETTYYVANSPLYFALSGTPTKGTKEKGR